MLVQDKKNKSSNLCISGPVRWAYTNGCWISHSKKRQQCGKCSYTMMPQCSSIPSPPPCPFSIHPPGSQPPRSPPEDPSTQCQREYLLWRPSQQRKSPGTAANWHETNRTSHDSGRHGRIIVISHGHKDLSNYWQLNWLLKKRLHSTKDNNRALPFVVKINRGRLIPLTKGPVIRKLFSCHDFIMFVVFRYFLVVSLWVRKLGRHLFR